MQKTIIGGLMDGLHMLYNLVLISTPKKEELLKHLNSIIKRAESALDGKIEYTNNSGVVRLKPESTHAGRICPGCEFPIRAGEYVTLVTIGPGEDPKARELARQHKPHQAVALAVHFACATGTVIINEEKESKS